MGKQESKTTNKQTGSNPTGKEQRRSISVKGKKRRNIDFNNARNLARYARFFKNPRTFIGA